MSAVATSRDSVNGGQIFAVCQVSALGSELIAKVGDAVGPHSAAPFGLGTHYGATLASGSPVVRINGHPMCRVGDPASCGHVIDSVGLVDIQDYTG